MTDALPHYDAFTVTQWTIWIAYLPCVTAALILAAIAGRPHRPLTAALAFALVSDVTLRLLAVFLFDPIPHYEGVRRLFAGNAAALYHVETALVSAWPCVVALVVLTAFAPRWRPYVVLAWAANAAQMALAYPLPQGVSRWRLFGVEVAALLVCGAVIRGQWTQAQRAAVVLAGIELAVVGAGPFVTDPYRNWSVATVMYGVGFLGLAGLLGRWRWTGRT